MALVCLAAGPATKPTTRPDATNALQAALADAQSNIAKAREAVMARCRETAEYRSASKDREAKEQTLDAARRDGTPQDRLAASSAFVKADQAVKKLEASALASDKNLADAAAKEAVIKSQIRTIAAERREREASAAKAAQDAKDNDPIQVAIRQGRLVAGMDEGQAKEAITKSLRARYPKPTTAVQLEPYVTDEDDLHIVTFECTAFDLAPGSPVGRQIVRTVRCEFRGGKLAHFYDKRLNVGE